MPRSLASQLGAFFPADAAVQLAYAVALVQEQIFFLRDALDDGRGWNCLEIGEALGELAVVASRLSALAASEGSDLREAADAHQRLNGFLARRDRVAVVAPLDPKHRSRAQTADYLIDPADLDCDGDFRIDGSDVLTTLFGEEAAQSGAPLEAEVDGEPYFPAGWLNGEDLRDGLTYTLQMGSDRKTVRLARLGETPGPRPAERDRERVTCKSRP